ncbi:hypothetical protein ACPEIF_21540 [Streptomyces sp. NPDC012600]|uniref:Translation initiation factor IF-2 n=1 Tax=Streptomyces stephensoniae TaxID=3375367 RepID=A0ABU2W4S1_9ACTN|nr:hypothetical protein [Streptomyces griseus]MDT0492132.1 hypothetical protein [Streptomyces griseus]
MENWREGARTGHTHEPNDVTVPLDGLGRQLAELPGQPAPPDGSDGPVFVDESGRRSKTYRRLGWVVASLCAAYAVTLVFAVLGGNSTAPWLPLSGPQEEAKAEEAEVRPAPSATPDPAEVSDGTPAPSGSAAPDPTASGGTTASPSPVLVPAGSTGRPTASVSLTPSADTGTGTGGTEATRKPAPSASAVKPSVPPTQPSPEPEPPGETEQPPVEPSESPVLEESAP